MPGKKTNNKKNFSAREKWLRTKKEGRPKQVWVWDNYDDKLGHWQKEEKG